MKKYHINKKYVLILPFEIYPRAGYIVIIYKKTTKKVRLRYDMAKTKTKQNNGFFKSLSQGFSDDRVPKMLGVLFFFLALVLMVSFASYIFTWKIDQDKVIQFSTELFSETNIKMANWLGSIGAVTSHLFFYWGFGLSSFFVVYFMYQWGIRLIHPHKVNMWHVIQNTVIGLVFTACVLDFLFSPISAFPWGGHCGQAINNNLQSLIGTLGLVLFFIFTGIGLVIWYHNPEIKDEHLNPSMPAVNLKMNWPSFNFFSKFYNKSKESVDQIVNEAVEETNKTEEAAEHPYDPLDRILFHDKPLTASITPKGDIDSINFDDDDELFDFELKDTRSQHETNKGDLALEIDTPIFEPIIESEEKFVDPLIAALEESAAERVLPELDPYDPTKELSNYVPPTLELLTEFQAQNIEVDMAELEANKNQIVNTLLNYKIEITKIKAAVGPTVTLYEIVPAPGVRISKIKNLEDDIALSLAALGIRIIAPIPGKGTIGIEVPNKNKQTVSIREVFQSEKFKNSTAELPIALGKTISNEVFVADLATMPHLLVAGATGQGKSVGINAILMSLLYKKHPSQVKLVLIDPKKVELSPYTKLENHFLAYLPNEDEPIITETKKVIHTLNSLCIEMDQRYDLLKKANVRNLAEYNAKFVDRRLNPEKGHRFMPYIVLVIDEFADLIMTAGKEIELPIGRLAQLARAIGIHLIIATQRPSVNIITGVIKANFPARLAFKVSSAIDSKTILDRGGANQLIGRGDMLLSLGGDMIRLQCAFVDTKEVEHVIDHIAHQRGYAMPFFLPEYIDPEGPSDELNSYSSDDLDDNFEEAARLIVQTQHGSTSMIQRRMKLGYNRSGRIMDQLEAFGIVGANEGSKPREVLIQDEGELFRHLAAIRNK